MDTGTQTTIPHLDMHEIHIYAQNIWTCRFLQTTMYVRVSMTIRYALHDIQRLIRENYHYAPGAPSSNQVLYISSGDFGSLTSRSDANCR
jgi:hypothetical protein